MNLEDVECFRFRTSGNSWGRKGSRYVSRAGVGGAGRRLLREVVGHACEVDAEEQEGHVGCVMDDGAEGYDEDDREGEHDDDEHGGWCGGLEVGM